MASPRRPSASSRPSTFWKSNRITSEDIINPTRKRGIPIPTRRVNEGFFVSDAAGGIPRLRVGLVSEFHRRSEIARLDDRRARPEYERRLRTGVRPSGGRLMLHRLTLLAIVLLLPSTAFAQPKAKGPPARPAPTEADIA